MTGARVRRAATLAMVSLALISSLLLLVLQGSAGASPAPGAEAMSIDMDTTGNTATALGPRDNCVSVNPGQTLDIDVTIANIPASNPMIAFQFTLEYASSAVSIQAAQAAFLLTANPGSQLFDASDSLPDTDGTWTASVADLDSATPEVGFGVLDRIRILVSPSAGPGVYPLYLSDAAYVDGMNNAIPPGTLNSAFVAVNASCDTLPTPTATPMSTPTPVISPPVLPTPPQTTPATPAPPGTPVPVPGSDVLIGIDHDGPPPDINPGSLVLPVGGAGSISVVAETGGTPVGAAELDVKYDPNLIHATGCSVAFGVCNSTFSDHVRIAMATVAGVSGVAKIADIDFQAVPQASGCSAVTVDVIAVGDVAGDPLTVSAVSGTICVGSTPTPAPTPTVPPPGHPTVSPIDRTPGPTPIEGAPPPFEPGNTTCIENFETPANCDGNTSPGANPDLRTKLCVGWGPDCDQAPNIPSVKDSSFDTLISFTPVEFLPGTVNAPIGAFSGRINITADFGLLNNPCNSSIDLGFALLEGSINTGELIDPKPVGSTDVFKPLAVDGNGNGIPDGAERYPSFLNTLFANAQPVRRLFGTAHVQGSWMTWNIVYFAPGSHIFVGNDEMTFDESVGVPAVMVLGDPTAPPPLGAITDFCAPFLMDLITLGKTIDNPCSPVPISGANCPINNSGGY
ncbi:MAG: hypothetical protein E6J42_03080, partial [Chloroflexi bacterium]